MAMKSSASAMAPRVRNTLKKSRLPGADRGAAFDLLLVDVADGLTVTTLTTVLGLAVVPGLEAGVMVLAMPYKPVFAAPEVVTCTINTSANTITRDC